MMEKLGALLWEASKKFTFVKIQGADSVLGNHCITLQFTILRNAKTMTHTEMLTLDAIENMSDPKTVIDAIAQKMGHAYKREHYS